MNAAITLMLIGMAALVMVNVPIAVALGVVAMLAIWIMQGSAMLPNTALVMFEGATNFPLLAVPLFVFAGGIMNASSIARRLINLATAVLGFIHPVTGEALRFETAPPRDMNDLERLLAEL